MPTIPPSRISTRWPKIIRNRWTTNSPRSKRSTTTISSRKPRCRPQVLEDTILSKEKDATALQESLFGKDGTLMKKRLELIQPIQKKVFDAINAYAQSHGYDLVLDSASNPTLLYNAPKLDQTEGVIKSLK